jgi:hypothetical protein
LPSNRLNELARTRLDFWTELATYMSGCRSPVKLNNPGPGHQLRASASALGNSDFALVAEATRRFDPHIAAGVEISGPGEYYRALEKDKAAIEKEIGLEPDSGQKFIWIPGRGTKVSDIWLYRHVDFFERRMWPEHHRWLCDKLEAFREVLGPRIAALVRQPLR